MSTEAPASQGEGYPFFYANRICKRIEVMTAVKHTDKTVWIKGRWNSQPDRIDRCAIKSDWGSYFPTREAATAHVKAMLEREIAQAERTIEAARLQLASL